MSGVVRGSGKQKIGALANLGAYYFAGIPSGALLAFVYHIGGKVKLTACWITSLKIVFHSQKTRRRGKTENTFLFPVFFFFFCWKTDNTEKTKFSKQE